MEWAQWIWSQWARSVWIEKTGSSSRMTPSSLPGIAFTSLEKALTETLDDFGSQTKQVGVSSSSNCVSPPLSENNMEAKFLGNAPCGHYKFKFPHAIRTESSVGAKVFFFKALLLTGDFSQAGKKSHHVWVSKEELGDYLKPKYLAQVKRFLLDLWWTELPVDSAGTGLRFGSQRRSWLPPLCREYQAAN